MTNKTVHPFKNHQMPLSMRLFFSGMTLVFKVLGATSPKLAGKLALSLFMKPPKFGTPKREKILREEADLNFLSIRDRKISIRSWGDKSNPTVLLSHGWGGRSTQFHAFIHPLVDAGFHVLAFDIPAHGDSEGTDSNMLDVASIIAAIEKEKGPFEAIIGHSFGTGTTLLAMDKYHVKAKKIVLIAYFSDVIWITQLFGEMFSLRESTLEAMRQEALRQFPDKYGITWTWDGISSVNTIKSITADILLIHDDDDTEVPPEQAIPLQKAAPRATVINTKGLGHRKILMSKKVIAASIEFIKSEE